MLYALPNIRAAEIMLYSCCVRSEDHAIAGEDHAIARHPATNRKMRVVDRVPGGNKWSRCPGASPVPILTDESRPRGGFISAETLVQNGTGGMAPAAEWHRQPVGSLLG